MVRKSDRYLRVCHGLLGRKRITRVLAGLLLIAILPAFGQPVTPFNIEAFS
jgi:hypothetical protein